MSTATAPAAYEPAPGTEYPFSISDIARATAQLLGPGWSAESGPWGVYGVISGHPYVADFVIEVDYEGDLTISYTGYEDDSLPESPELPEGVADRPGGVYLVEAYAGDGLKALAERAAAALRAVTGYDPAAWDLTSSASCQHYIDTGRYLRAGDAESA
ncbi:hypothetical protein SAMN05216483_6684 [Streptomyces sp. 2131.1]|uniref:hypothetical protein n=1 Tax=Streptomyces sp. 2131.1 TaxID=1855346 RepID=UPI000897B760|nr:hypothetical protein [Streptomyces sp. 2131.1]SEE82861.1 hypothetical protein SAMN05216483_6684 [Streptomyces sp. 2131.1]